MKKIFIVIFFLILPTTFVWGREFKSVRGDYTLPSGVTTVVKGTKGIAEGDLIIPSDATLQMDPDSTLEFENEHKIIVEGTIIMSSEAKIVKVDKVSMTIPWFEDDFNDENLDGWYPLSKTQGWVTGREGDRHYSRFELTARNGYMEFYRGDFIGLDVFHDIGPIPAGQKKLILEFDTKLGGTWAHFNIVNLLDEDNNVVVGGGISRCGYCVWRSGWDTEARTHLYFDQNHYEKSFPTDTFSSGTWYHVKVVFNEGQLTLTCNGKVHSKTVSSKIIPVAITKIHIRGWQHTKGACFDNIKITTE